MRNWHLREANQLGVDLLSLLSARFPHELAGEYVESFTDKIFLFAYHARRLVELQGKPYDSQVLRETPFDGIIDREVKEKLRWDFYVFLDYVVHCQSFEVGVGEWAGKKRYVNVDRESYISHITLRTDRANKPELVFYPHSMVSHYLSKIAALNDLRSLRLRDG